MMDSYLSLQGQRRRSIMLDTVRRGADRASRLARAAALSGTSGKVCPANLATRLLEAIIEPGDRVTIEGDNQKQADFLASALAKVDPARVHDLHMVQSVLALPDHLAVFERGIANCLDFAYAGPQSRKLAELVANGTVKIGAIHTYLELYARMLVDLTPRVALIVADKADRDGNLYTGPNTEDTPTITEAAAFRGGIVVAQVNEIVDRLPRVDVPGDWVDVVVPSPKLYLIDPLFTRDPAKIRNENVLMAMMAIAAVYEPYQVRPLNHGIGYATAPIELILPTYAAQRGLKGKIARHFVLNPHPTLIPAIEAGFVDSVYCFGSELGMERYVSNHADIFPVGANGNLRSNRALAQVAGQYACESLRGRKLVVQMVQTHQPNGAPSFVERLDAFDLAASAGFALPPVMIYGDDVTHVVTECGVANLLRCWSPQERVAALRAVAGYTDFGKRHSPETTEDLRRRGIVMFPSDLGIDEATATHDLLAARTIDELVTASGGLYAPPAKFRRTAGAAA